MPPPNPDARGSSTAIGNTSGQRIDRGHVSAGQADQIVQGEPLGRLLQRLGTPPEDLAEHLRRSFREACRGELQRGRIIQRVDPNDWSVRSDAQICYRGQAPTVGSDGQAILAERLDQLCREFRRILALERPAVSRLRTSAEPLGRVPRRATPAARHSIEADPIGSFDDAEQRRRDRIVESFTAALVDRFGEENVLSSPETESSRGVVKRTPIKRDRPFNWNLVLAVGTVATIIGMVITGVTIHHLRQQRLAAAPRSTAVRAASPDSKIPTGQDPTSIAIDQADEYPPGLSEAAAESVSVRGEATAAASKEDETRDPKSSTELSGASDDPANVEFSTNSAFSRAGSRDQPVDMLELLDGIADEVRQTRASSESPHNTADGNDVTATPDRLSGRSHEGSAGELLKMLGEPESVEAGQNDAAADEPDGTDSDPEPDRAERIAAEMLKSARGSDPRRRFEPLPAIDDPDPVSLGIPATATIAALQSLGGQRFRLDGVDGAGTRAIVEVDSGETIALLTRSETMWQFRWTDRADSVPKAMELFNARLVDDENQPWYLRPGQIMEQPFRLPLETRPVRASWDLRTPVNREDLRLNLGLSVPETLKVQWQGDYNRLRPTQDSSTAIITARDDEDNPVAVRVVMDVTKCGRELEIRFQAALRLDPSARWLSLQEFERLPAQVFAQSLVLERRIEFLKDQAQRGSNDKRQAARRQREELEKMEQQLTMLDERIRAAEELFLTIAPEREIDSQVRLQLDLTVSWHDGETQLILKTAE